MRSRDYVAAIALTALICASRSDSATLPRADDFLRGPAQWFLTGDETRAIRSAKSDEEAQKAIDLFWVRRDPTPGTARNEFRDEYDARVIYADREFKFRNKRGALTDAGKIYLLLGPPRELQSFGRYVVIDAATDEAGLNHGTGGRFEWTYPLGTGNGLSGPVIFIENMNTGEYSYDIQHANVGGAISLAKQRAVISPGLTEVPAWAVEKPAAPEMTIPSLAPGTAPAATPPAPRAPLSSRSPAAPEAPLPLLPAGVRTLVLTKDVMAIDPRGAGDPLAKAAKAVSFTAQDDLGYAFQYCGGSRDVQPALGLTLTISGESEGKKVHFSAADDDLVPDGIPSLPGCFLVRGSLPLSEVGRGTYELAVRLTDKTSSQKYDLKHDFKVE